MAVMERKNRELKRQLARAKAQQQRTSEASFAYIMGGVSERVEREGKG